MERDHEEADSLLRCQRCDHGHHSGAIGWARQQPTGGPLLLTLSSCRQLPAVVSPTQPPVACRRQSAVIRESLVVYAMENSECCTLDFTFCCGVRVEPCKPGKNIVSASPSDRVLA